MFGSCFSKLILTIVFENNILGPICLQFLKTIFCSKKKEQGKHKNTFGSLSFCYENIENTINTETLNLEIKNRF